MSQRRQLWETLATFLTQLEQETDAALGKESQLASVLEELKGEIRKLGKAQFKANAMAEGQSAKWEQAAAEAEAARQQQAQLIEQIAAERVADRERELLEAFLPVLDGLESAIASGQRYLAIRDQAATAPGITPAQAVLVSPSDRVMLSAWLEGLRMVRDRMLAILESNDVTPTPTVGQPFDPHLHIAVGVTEEGTGPPGTIVAQERSGYRSASGVLRYAEVIVYRP